MRGASARGRGGAGEPTVGRSAAGEPDGCARAQAHGCGARRHGAFRHHRPAGNMISATPSGGWLQSSPVIPDLGFPLGHARLRCSGSSTDHPGRARAGQAAAHHAHADPGAARRRAVPGLGHARAATSRTSGSPQFFLRHVHAGHEPAGGDRRAGLAHRAFPVLVLAAHGAPGRGRGREAACRRRPSTSCARRGHVVEVGDAWSEGRLTAASREGVRRRAAPTRAACRLMRLGSIGG